MLLKISHEVPIPRGLCHGHSYYLYKRQSYYDTRIHNLRTCLLFGLKLFISQKNNRIICLNENLELLLVIYNVTLMIALDLEEIKKKYKIEIVIFHVMGANERTYAPDGKRLPLPTVINNKYIN